MELLSYGRAVTHPVSQNRGTDRADSIR